MKPICLLAAAFLLVSDFQIPGLACMMTPKGYPGRISQNSHKAIIVHRDDKQDMILKIGYEFAGDTTPDKFAWIVTVPSEPEKYNVTKDWLFREMNVWAHDLVWKRPKNLARNGFDSEPTDGVQKKKKAPLIFGKPAKVGPYDIQPVKARGLDALTALNKWLSKNGFPTEDPDHMKYFVKNEFTFLAIKISPEKGGSISKSGSLPPLHLSFKTKNVYYPLMFSSRQGVFDLQLFTLTDKKLNYSKSAEALKKLNWKDYDFKRNVPIKKPDILIDLRMALKKSAFSLDQNKMYLNVLTCKDVNTNNSITTWKKDIFLTTSGYSISNAALPIFIPLGFIAMSGILVAIIFFRMRNESRQSATVCSLGFAMLLCCCVSSGCNQDTIQVCIGHDQEVGATKLRGLDHLNDYLCNKSRGGESWYRRHRKNGMTTAEVIWNFQPDGRFFVWIEPFDSKGAPPNDFFAKVTGLKVSDSTEVVTGKWKANLKELKLSDLKTDQGKKLGDQSVSLRWLDGKLRIDINQIQLKRHSGKMTQPPEHILKMIQS